MKSSWLSHLIIRTVSFIIASVFLVSPLTAWCSGYQESKLFDNNVYTVEELRKKIEHHSREIKVLNDQIKSLEMDIDWLVLKINQIQDSGRIASLDLKDSIRQKEKKIITLSKTRNRLEYLVKYYSGLLASDEPKDLEEIMEGKIPVSAMEKPDKRSKKAMSKSSRVTTYLPKSAAKDGSGDQDLYDGVSKKELELAVEKAGLSDWVEIIGTGSCLRMETTLPILFPTGSARVGEEYKVFLKKMAHFLKPYDVKVLVTGYADKVPIKNEKYPSNFELGATRAANIVHQFVTNGLKPSIFRIESTGKYRFASKELSKQKTLERRAEVTVIFSG